MRQLGCLAQVFWAMRERELPMVIDADGLYIVTKNLELVMGYPHAILTPNKNEYQRLASALNIDTEEVCPSHLAHSLLHSSPARLRVPKLECPS